MKIKHLALPIIAITLCGCSKTSKLYKLGAYESPNFMANYYLKNDTAKFEYEEVEEIPLDVASVDGLTGLKPEDRGLYAWSDPFRNSEDVLWGYHNNLGRVDESFRLGAISKLYDGRVRCDGLQQKSRAQLDKVGYDAKFPMIMSDCDYFAFSARGGTTLVDSTLAESNITQLLFNFEIGFFTIDPNNTGKYIKHIFNLENIKVETDNSAKTDLISFYIEKGENGKSILENTVAMSFKWECVDPCLESFNLTDDRTVKQKDHLALMLYEVFLGNSTWHK